MDRSRFDALIDRIEVLYDEDRLRDAIDLLDAGSPGLEAWAADLAHIKACLLAVSGDPDAALRVLQDASAAGAWWHPSILTDDDLAALRERPEFHQLVEVSKGRVAADPRPPVVLLPDGAPVGVVVALHGAGLTAAHSAREWAGVLPLDHALVCLESSQRMSPMYRTWPDRDHAVADIARALGQLPTELDGVPPIAAGFSAGGRVALDWALTADPVEVAGVIVMAPALRELPTTAAGSLSPASILIGADDGLVETVDQAADRLTGFGCTVERLPGLGHGFPADFADRLAELLR
ncbi:phospholipase [Kribbella capetownensis]|uniref:Phospholipase n=1 Tax=Kribbella capetownensis TaxID=1572659 RepID=A0A4R0JUR9_9ACTN|nr:phospholipase [Kribbella capetownensis]TCC45965.1 phospholipase [Kribbella capetownensis]